MAIVKIAVVLISTLLCSCVSQSPDETDVINNIHGLCHDTQGDVLPFVLTSLTESISVLRTVRGIESTVVGEMINCMKRVCSPLEVDTFSIEGCEAATEFMTVNVDQEPLEMGTLDPLVVASMYNDLATGVASLVSGYKERFLRAALLYRPGELVILKNLGFLLEQTGRHPEASSLYASALEAHPGDPSLNLIYASMCPPHHMSSEGAREVYERIVSRFHRLLSVVSHNSIRMDPAMEVGQMPLGWPYMGFNLRPLNELLGRTYELFFPILVEGGLDAAVVEEEEEEGRRPLRLGIVAESIGNTSPGNLLEAVLERLGARPDVDIIFFKPPGLLTDFSQTLDSISSESHTLSMYSTLESQGVIRGAKCDVLLYLALGMSPATYYVSFGRLAPVQCVFGHGHPITTGLGSVDYFISSDLFQTYEYGGLRDGGGGGYEGKRYEDVGVDEVKDLAMGKDILSSGLGHLGFTEQLVMFDTLTVHLRPPVVRMGSVKLSDYGLSEGWNYYACLQYSKKMHPEFDKVIGGILRKDKNGRILLLEGSRIFVERFKGSGFDDDMLSRLVFVKRMPRYELLQMLGLCRAFLGTFPWGEGVTSFEALSMDLPVVVLPAFITVEQLALGQLRMLGIDKTLAASSVEEYVKVAVRLGGDDEFKEGITGWIKEQKWRIFGEGNLDAVAKEWGKFLFRAAGR